MNLRELKAEVRRLASPARAKSSLWFFKTGPGEYGEGDRFLGLTMPQLRSLARPGGDLSEGDIKNLLASPFHEERMLGALLIMERSERADSAKEQAKWARFYLSCRDGLNNWDLIDVTAPRVLGPYFWNGDRRRLMRLAASRRLWDRRLAVLSTFYFIREGRFAESLQIARRLIKDSEDLMHKALGWMLREIGKRDLPVLDRFLTKHAARMPRTMLRYAIERHPEPRRRFWLEI